MTPAESPIYVFATANQGKLKEAKEVAERFGVTLVGTHELTYRVEPPPDVPENHPDYFGNAREKSAAIYAWSDLPSVGDDSGLEVAALMGAPGVLTARYAGQNATSEANIRKLLDALAAAADRRARFRCVLCLCSGEEIYQSYEAVLEGQIALAARGSGGFGYDPIFIPEGETRTLAEIKETRHIKTHRVLAFEKLFKAIV